MSKEWIVFLHGFGGSSSIWFKQIRSFAGEFNLLLIDLRGHGRSKPEIPYSMQYTYREIACDILEVLDSLQLGACHFIGVSIGSIVVREIAEINVSRVKSMVMAGAVVKFNLRSEFLINTVRLLQYFIPYMWIYRIYSTILMPKKRHRESRWLFIYEAMKMKQREFMRWFSLTANLNPLLCSFRSVELPIPTLYLMGDEDYMFLPQVKALIKTHTCHSSLVVVPDSGHICNVDNAPFFNREALLFLKTATAG
jgi:pimeloyl-ACP methyl ester carboxylesterase